MSSDNIYTTISGLHCETLIDTYIYRSMFRLEETQVHKVTDLYLETVLYTFSPVLVCYNQ